MSYQVLLVDDDKNIRDLFRAYLSEFYDVVDASNGQEALDLLKKPNDVDVIVLDVMMPGMRGTDVVKEIKKLSPSMPVVIWTAFGTKDVAVAALKGRADDFVEKPLNVAKVREVIEGILKAKDGRDHLDAFDTRGKIEKVRQFMAKNVDKKVGLLEAASIVCLSPKYLSRVFKEETGSSFARYRAEIKVRKAKELLAGTGYNISQISDKLGYENVESFIRTFRRVAHCTPSSFRNHEVRS